MTQRGGTGNDVIGPVYADRVHAPHTRTYAGRPVTDRQLERRARFIDAANAIYGEKGFTASTLTDVCAAAKLSRRQFYELFDNPEALLVAAYDDTQQMIRDAVVRALSSATESDPRRVAQIAMRAFLAAIGNEPHRVRVTFVEIVGVSDAIEARREQIREQWAVLTEALGTRFGVLRPMSSEEHQLAAATMIGAINGLVHRWCLHQPGYPLDALVEMLSDVIVALYAP